MAEYDPMTETETLLVERLANLFWRERRLIQAERSELNMPNGDPNAIVIGTSAALPMGQQLLIGRYQSMLTNQISSTIMQIQRIQNSLHSDL
ncbi:hypothetical protein K3172_11125 [Qipengyuania sp. 6B39]|uniref:hypothetical protein n=1 Tax=Qipengyuania proteolytica TaxID=2867239 RepID=UPI001C8A727A|nr:hypothetical protein [Qipengyuania proteolytica]MBX7496405.1 hypothetical protein [Qipengyuania proteolytica]